MSQEPFVLIEVPFQQETVPPTIPEEIIEPPSTKLQIQKILQEYYVARKGSSTSKYNNTQTIRALLAILPPNQMKQDPKPEPTSQKRKNDDETPPNKRKGRVMQSRVGGPWSLEEEETLLDLIHCQTPFRFDWKSIGKKFINNRSAEDVRKKYVKLGKSSRYTIVGKVIYSGIAWNKEEEDKFVSHLVGKAENEIYLDKIRETEFPNRSVTSLVLKYKSLQTCGKIRVGNDGIIKIEQLPTTAQIGLDKALHWTEAEDNHLLKLIEGHNTIGFNWIWITNTHFPEKYTDSIRARFKSLRDEGKWHLVGFGDFRKRKIVLGPAPEVFSPQILPQRVQNTEASDTRGGEK
jgi:hypothetical protein